MKSLLNPYINFQGQARDAIEFYKTVFGGKLTMSTFKEGGAPVGPDEENNIMHAMLEVDNGMVIMVSDTPNHMSYKPGSNVSMSLSGESEEELKGYWDKLAVGATIEQPLAKAPWGDMFGMLTDKFGIHWLVNIAAKKA